MIRLIISIISCSSEPISSSNNPAVIRENKHKYCLLLVVFNSTFAIGTTAVVDGGEDGDDVIEDSNVVGECVRTRLQFRFNSVVIVSFEGEKRNKRYDGGRKRHKIIGKIEKESRENNKWCQSAQNK